MEKLDGMSMDIEKTEREKLRAVFPECFVEDKLDIDKLLTMCGEYITNDFGLSGRVRVSACNWLNGGQRERCARNRTRV